MIRIGLIINEYENRGVILQSCKTLPKHHNRKDEVGPFYGVSYESGDYVWYNKEQMEDLLKTN